MSTLTITTIQSNLLWEEKSANLRLLEEKIRGIAEKTEIVILPEMFNTGFSMNPSQLAETMNGETMSWMKKVSRENGVILTGSAIICEEGKYFNRLICKMRERFGTRLIPMKETFREILKNSKELNATAFIADQSPNPSSAHWMNFLNQDTAVFMGTEKIAQKIKYPIVFVSVKKLTRGYYTLMAEILETPPYTGNEGDITETHTRKLEADIVEQPETWLWAHKRWKHQRK